MIATPQNYWISSNALRIALNANGSPDYIMGNASAGAMILCYIKEEEGLGYDAGHNYQRWPLSLSPTLFNTTTEKYVYVAIPRTRSVGEYAVVVFPSEVLDIYGKNEQGTQVGSTDYFYIWLQGIISASEVDGVEQDRVWTQHVATGFLSSDEAIYAGGDDTWFKYSSVDDTVTFLKELLMDARSFFSNLRIGNRGKQVTDIVTSEDIYTDSDTIVATPGYVEKHYLSKSHDDETPHSLTVGQNLTVKKNLSVMEWITAMAMKVKTIVSPDYTGDGIADSGFRLTNDYNGHSKLTVDELYVRMKAVFEALEVKKELVTGGNQIQSCAANVISRVDYLNALGEPLGYRTVKVPYLAGGKWAFLSRSLAKLGIFSRTRTVRVPLTQSERNACAAVRCYFLAEENGRKIQNWWQVADPNDTSTGNDLARCQTFNLASDSVSERDEWWGVSTAVTGNIFWWRKVIGKSTTPDTIEGRKYHYIDVAINDCATGSCLPAPGDEVSQFGNDHNPDRMNLIVHEVNGEDAAVKMYEGINQYSLTTGYYGDPLKARLSPKSGYKFDGSKFEITTEYHTSPMPIERGAWSNGSVAFYYDLWQHNGSTWLCLATSNQRYVVKEAITGYTVGQIITSAQYNVLSEENKAKCYRMTQGSTTLEPSDQNSSVWRRYASKGDKGDDGNSVIVEGDARWHYGVDAQGNPRPTNPIDTDVDDIDLLDYSEGDPDMIDVVTYDADNDSYFYDVNSVPFGTCYIFNNYLYEATATGWRNLGKFNADSWTIGQDGYWYKNGVRQSTKAEGKDGTGVQIKGEVANQALLPTTGVSVGDCYITNDDRHLWTCTGDSPVTWLDLGIFKGEKGDNSYMHIAYADNVESDGQGGITVTGFSTTKQKAAYDWIGLLTDNQVGDSTTPSDYEWNKVKGAAGSSAVVYTIECTDTIKPGDEYHNISIRRAVGSTIQTKTLDDAITRWGVYLTSSQGVIEDNNSDSQIDLTGVTITSGTIINLILHQGSYSGGIVASKTLRSVVNGANGKDGWMITANPANVIITQALANNVSSFSVAKVGFTAKKGSVAATVASIASVSSTEFNVAVGTGADAGKVVVSSPNTYTPQGGSAQYYTQGSFTVDVNVVDPDTSQAVSFSVTVLCYANLLGSWKEQVIGDMKTEVAEGKFYFKDENGNVVAHETIGDFIKSSTENTSRLQDTVTGGIVNLLLGTENYPSDNHLVHQSSALDGVVEYDGLNDRPHIYTPVALTAGEKYVLQVKSNGTLSPRHDGAGPSDVQGKYTVWLRINGTGYYGEVFTSENLSGTLADGTKYWVFECQQTGEYWFRTNTYSDGTTEVTVDFWEIMLQKGTIPSGWALPPRGTSSLIRQTATEIEAKVNDTGVNITDGEINLIAGKVNFCNSQGTAQQYVQITSDGKIKATDGEFSGKVTATEGAIGGLNINSSSIYSTARLSDDSDHKIRLSADGSWRLGEMYGSTAGTLYGKGLFINNTYRVSLPQYSRFLENDVKLETGDNGSTTDKDRWTLLLKSRTYRSSSFDKIYNKSEAGYASSGIYLESGSSTTGETDEDDIYISYRTYLFPHFAEWWHAGATTTISASGVNQSSDMRLKDVKQDCDVTLEQVAGAPLFYYTYKEDEEKVMHVGTSAQYWQEILPMAVGSYTIKKGEKEEEYLNLNYDDVSTVSAIITAKEVLKMRKEIDELKAIIKELQNRQS